MDGTALVLALAVSVVVLSCLTFYLLISLRNARRKRAVALEYQERRYRPIFDAFARIAKLRTGLSEGLISLSIGGGVPDDYAERANTFLKAVCDETKRAASAYAKNDCTVSIKVVLPGDENDGRFRVKTIARDTVSAAARAAVYDNLEPFVYSEHELIRRLIEEQPKERFEHFNDLTVAPENYRNPNLSWKKQFTSSAIHVIADPDSDDIKNIYGFLMIDSERGRFDGVAFRALMETISSIVYFAVHALAAIELVQEIRQREDGESLTGGSDEV